MKGAEIFNFAMVIISNTQVQEIWTANNSNMSTSSTYATCFHGEVSCQLNYKRKSGKWDASRLDVFLTVSSLIKFLAAAPSWQLGFGNTGVRHLFCAL